MHKRKQEDLQKLSWQRRLLYISINLLYVFCILLLVFIVGRIFVFASYKIPSDSMNPTLIKGDYIWVWKGVPGPRIFNVFKAIRKEEVKIKRVPGFRKIRRNDVLVFNYPYADFTDSVTLNLTTFFIKRCIALPGDTLAIQEGFYEINGRRGQAGLLLAQRKLAKRAAESWSERNYHCFRREGIDWTLHRFGPIYVPAAGDSIAVNASNIAIYRNLIRWERGETVKIQPDSVWLEGKPLTFYRFLKNYYFMGGDNMESSQDSRYWGLLPEEYIVGQAVYIWKSVDGYGDWRWNRCGKKIR